MPRFSANLSTLFTDRPMEERFAAAAAAGFPAVEIQFPYDHPVDVLAKAAKAADVAVALINAPAGDWSAGERGFFAIPGREDEVAPAMERALVYAEALDCPRIHVLAGIVGDAIDPETAAGTYLGNLEQAAARAAEVGRTVLIEPINQRDVPDYFLSFQDEALGIVEAVGAPNLKVLLDFYHCQIMEGDLIRSFQTMLSRLGHLQIAGVPDRAEPDRGEINYPALFAAIDAAGWDGFVGCEYFPAGRTEDGLAWGRSWGIGG
jgi:hydroxypyruvate isomerase